MSCRRQVGRVSNKRNITRPESRPKVLDQSINWMRGADWRHKDAVSKKNDDYIGTS